MTNSLTKRVARRGIALFLLAGAFHSTGWADTISKEVIFSNSVFVGAARCSDVTGDAYCETPALVFDTSGAATQTKEKLQAGCVQGGGDCLMVVFATETKSADQDHLLVRALTVSKQPVWVRVSKNKFKKLEDWMPKLGEGENSIEFREELKSVYTDKGLSHPLEISAIAILPQGKTLNFQSELIEYRGLPVSNVKGKKVIGVEVNLVKYDQAAAQEDRAEAMKKAKKTKLREIYFPAYDSKGRINYWFVPDPGC